MGQKKSVLAGRILELRTARRLTQAQLAKEADLPAAAISHFETGLRTPGTSTLRRLADALGVSFEYLLGRDEEPTGAGPRVGAIFRNLRELSDDSLKILEDFSRQLKARDEEKKRGS
jgi:transcriptional regulator with XRE-family HTH domain